MRQQQQKQQQSQQQHFSEEESRGPHSSPVNAVEVEDLASLVRSLDKHPRRAERMVRKYVPPWGVLTEDAISVPAPALAKEIGGDLCRGLMLPKDRPVYERQMLEPVFRQEQASDPIHLRCENQLSVFKKKCE
ncbi:hypothetical protein OROMI_020532 [Orobanche minor]